VNEICDTFRIGRAPQSLGQCAHITFTGKQPVKINPRAAIASKDSLLGTLLRFSYFRMALK
jgi:hypothetical protein